MRRPTGPVLVAVLIALLVAGCAREPAQQPRRPAAKRPDTLTVVRVEVPETLDPAYAYGTASAELVLWNVYETLLFYDFYDGESTANVVPLLAAAVPTLHNGGISADGRTYAFTIRENVAFHDGSPLTAADVKYSLLRFMFMDRAGGPSWILLEPILGVSETRTAAGTLKAALFDQADRAIRVQGNTVAITLQKPFAPFLAIMARWAMVTSRQWAIAQGDWDGTKGGLRALNNPAGPEETKLFSAAMGTGPFKLASWDRQRRQVILERNDAYWRDAAKLTRVIVKVVDDAGQRTRLLQQGDADIATVDRTEQPDVEELEGVRIVDDLPQLANVGIFMNQRIDTGGGNPDVGSGRLDGNGVSGDFFADVNVRRGVAQAIDYDAAIRDCYRGQAQVGHGPIPRGLFGYASRRGWYAFDREKAERAFREAQGGRLWEGGFKFTVLFNSGNTARQCLAQMVKASLQALNPRFKVSVRGVTWAQYLSLHRAGKLPMWIIGWTADYADPDNFVPPYMLSTGTYARAQGYANPEADGLIEQARREPDARRRAQLYAQLQEIAYHDIPTIWLDPTALQVMRSWVQGWYHNPAFPGLYLYPIYKS